MDDLLGSGSSILNGLRDQRSTLKVRLRKKKQTKTSKHHFSLHSYRTSGSDCVTLHVDRVDCLFSESTIRLVQGFISSGFTCGDDLD